VCPAVAEEPLYTLSQVFVELTKPSISPKTIHMQVYSYNDWYVTAIKRRIGALFPLARPWLTALLSRLMAVQGVLAVRALATHQGDAAAFWRRPVARPGGRRQRARLIAIDEIVGTLRSHRRHLRAVALTPLLERGAPGRGYHTGGSFPMRAQPSRFESDRWGRPYGFERVHVVDASVFPSIPSGRSPSASWRTLTGLRRNALDPESGDGRRVVRRGARDRTADLQPVSIPGARRPHRAARASVVHLHARRRAQARGGQPRHEELAGISRTRAPARLVALADDPHDRRQHH
jgi:hypothetical protein